MTDLNVRIVTLPPLRVAAINGFGPDPENQAFEKMRAWAAEQHLSGQPHRLFGFDNPTASPGSPNHGYDVWLTVDESVPASGEARILDFPGGLYAVTRIEVHDPWHDIPSTWQKLVTWMEASPYNHGRHQWLEEHLGPLNETVNELPFTLDLYLPIVG